MFCFCSGFCCALALVAAYQWMLVYERYMPKG